VTFFVADAEQDDYREFLTSEPYDLVTAHLCFSPLVVERSFEALRGGGRFVLALPEIQQWQETGRRPRHAWDEDGALNVLRDRGFTVEYAGIETEIAAHGSPQEMLAAWVESPARPSWLDADRVQGLREYAVRGGTRLTVRSHLIVRARKPRNAGGAPLRDGGAPV
jgi:SAM-dependent methyltransferase